MNLYTEAIHMKIYQNILNYFLYIVKNKAYLGK